MSEQVEDRSVSNAVPLWTAMQVLRDEGRPMDGREVLARMADRLAFTPYWLERLSSGQVRWEVGTHWFAGDAATIGWMTKLGGWAITEAGIEALEEFPTPELLFAERSRRYPVIDQRRKQAQASLSEVQQFIDRTLRLVDAGGWPPRAWSSMRRERPASGSG